MTEQPPENPSKAERQAEFRRLVNVRMQARWRARRDAERQAREIERRRVCAWQVSGPLWEAELQAHFRTCEPYTLPLRPPPGLKSRPPQTRPYDQETDQ